MLRQRCGHAAIRRLATATAPQSRTSVLRRLSLARDPAGGVASCSSRKPISDAEIEALLLVALYQLQWTRAAPHAVVDSAVRTCARLGKASAKGLVNAVLRRFLRERDALLERARATARGPFLLPAVVDRRDRARVSRIATQAILDSRQPAPAPDVARQSPP